MARGGGRKRSLTSRGTNKVAVASKPTIYPEVTTLAEQITSQIEALGPIKGYQAFCQLETVLNSQWDTLTEGYYKAQFQQQFQGIWGAPIAGTEMVGTVASAPSNTFANTATVQTTRNRGNGRPAKGSPEAKLLGQRIAASRKANKLAAQGGMSHEQQPMQATG